MKIGLKVFPQSFWKFKAFNKEGVLETVKHFDYVELMAIKGSDMGIAEKLKEKGIEFVLHTMHFGWGVNLGNREKRELNLSVLNYAQEIADRLDAKYIITHCGRLENSRCSLDNAIELLKELKDRRFLVENLPKVCEGMSCLGWGPEELGRAMKETGLGMCLDFAHASESAFFLKRKPVDFMKDMMKLKPSYFHISDGMNDGIDHHLHLGEGELPMKEYIRMIPRGKMVCIETSPEPEKLVRDAEFMRRNR